jgi:ubiquinol-cytochrome c reductase iron-sulfur subunit
MTGDRGDRDGMTPRSPGGELVVAGALVAASVCAAAFVLVYVTDRADTQLLGLSIGLCLGAVAVAAIVAGTRVVDQSEAVEERPQLVDEGLEREVTELGLAAGDGVSRRRLLAGAAGLAGASLTAAAVVPLASLGPGDVGRKLKASPWRRGVRLVDVHGAPVTADELGVGSFVTAIAEGSDARQLGASVVVVRIAEAEVLSHPEWAPRGIMAYSKICTHAACAVALFRYPTYEQTSDPPALVCPCHYSTFDVRKGAEVIFGPAGRPLPQLPLSIDAGGQLVAAAPLNGAPGPAWWGVRET